MVVGDTSRPEGAAAIVSESLRAVPQVEILFNNVGTGSHTLPEEMEFDEFADNLRVNLHSSFLIAKGFGRAMIDGHVPRQHHKHRLYVRGAGHGPGQFRF